MKQGNRVKNKQLGNILKGHRQNKKQKRDIMKGNHVNNKKPRYNRLYNIRDH